MTPVKLTADLVEAFGGTFLSPLYDNPSPTPAFHRDCWKLYCSEATLASVVAPRYHAKSTALTHVFGLAVALFRAQDFIVIASATEELAINHLGDIAKELRENEDLIREFKIKGLSTDAKTDIVIDFADGHQARFVARGSGQKMRGLKWNGKRPGLIIGDDLEEDEQVENLDRRKKFRRWVNRALIPCLRKGGIARIHGTILHEDAYLARIQRAKSWSTLFFKAHRAFDDFSSILWPELWPESRLRLARQAYIDDGDADGYAQEYLNDPADHSQAYLRPDDLLPMTAEHHAALKLYYVGCDFAVSKTDTANRSSFTVGGVCPDNLTAIVDQYAKRWDTLEWIEVLFSIQARYRPEAFFVEDGVIWKAVSPMIFKEMLKRNIWMNLVPLLPIKDKAVRGRPFQKRTRAHGVVWDQEADWWEDYKQEVLKFTGVTEALADDQFDSTATLFLGLEHLPEVDDDDFPDEDEEELIRTDPRLQSGRSSVTGY